MKKSSLFVAFLMVILLAGCSSPKNSTDNSKDNSKLTPSEFVALLEKQFDCNTQNDLTKISGKFSDPSYPDAKIDAFLDITPDEVRQEIGCQIFKNKTVPITFIVYHDVAYQIAAPVYGNGILDIHTCDFDHNGQIDLIYSISVSLSGIYTPAIGSFNFTSLKEKGIYSAINVEDFVLQKVNNESFTLYTIDPSSKMSTDYSQMTLIPGKEIGTITSEKNTPVVHIK